MREFGGDDNILYSVVLIAYTTECIVKRENYTPKGVSGTARRFSLILESKLKKTLGGKIQ